MKDYYCLNLKFKDSKISLTVHHSHLFVSDNEMYFQIIDNNTSSQIDNYFTVSENALGFFEENFEIVNAEIEMYFDNSRIYKVVSFESDDKNRYFTIYVSNICLIKENVHKELIDEGKAFLNKNGLKVVNLFYSFFTNLLDKNVFSISRMNGMTGFYEMENLSYRPELEFSNNEKRGSEEFTIKKIPTIKFKFKNIEYAEIKGRIQMICNFLSFCFGIRINIEKIIFRTEDKIFIFRNTEPNNKTYVSDFSTVFRLLKDYYNVEKILSTDWFAYYIENEKKITKSIDNYLHSREVNLGASFLLLFNIIEIFKINTKQEKFKFNNQKNANFDLAFEHLKESLDENENPQEFKQKWQGIINKLEFKPFQSPLEETLMQNNINSSSFGFNFKKLKETRDKITHGSLNSIKEEDLKSQIYCLRKIAISLILANLGLKNDIILKDT